MEGLEVSIISNKDIIDDNEEYRLDADYYKKEYLNLYNLINDGDHLVDIVSMSDLSSNASFATVSGIVNDGNPKVVPFIRSGNVGNTFINSAELEFISKEAHLQLSKSVTKLHDIMMARKGKIGGASLIMDDEVNYNCNENVIKLTLNDQKEINPFYFTAYFNSKFGYKQVERLSTGNVQPWVPISQLRKLYFKNKSVNFQREIEQTIKNAHNYIQQSKSLYTAAENLLLEELGLQHWQPTRQSYSTKTFKESYQSSGRLDAEYYQLKYDELITLLADDNLKLLGDIVSIQKSIEPGSDAYQAEGIPFIRVADLSKNGLSEPNIFLSAADFGEFPVMPKKDTILLSKDGSVGIAYKVEEDLKAITSGAILHLAVTDKNVLPDYLTLVLNSIVVKLQAERDAGGSIIQHWKPDEIKKVLIPVIDMNLQSQITTKIQQSFALQQQSKQLLEAAKTAVEIAIEQDEAVALKYLKSVVRDEILSK